jgi:selenocysteine-specific elongation factor
MHVVATAGHVDHGKSSLVLALTGTDPDRFAEEKRRGLTIDLGFAHATLPSGAGVSFVDVPGHVRFLKNMLAGVGAVDACLFVVAATEGWKPQSEEHLRILELLGARHGLIALTKVDVVDDEHAEIAQLDVLDHVAGTFLEDAELVPVSAPTGRGLDDLRAALDRLLEHTPRAANRNRPRLWVDRVFAARGAGTVVTGTLAGGTLQVDQQLEVSPLGRAVRIRSLQSLGRQVERIGPGNRTAVNLVGVEHTQVERGHALIEPGRWRPTTTFDASLRVLSALDHDVSRRGAWVLYAGSGEHPCRMRVLGTEAIAPGTDGMVRIHVRTPLPLLPGDRFVLRESGRGETVGGGEVLDVAPTRPASKAAPDRSIERVVRERGFVTVDDLEALTGERVSPTLGRWVADPAAVAALQAKVRSQVDAAGPLGLDVASLDERGREVLARLEDVQVTDGRARVAEVVDPLADHPFVASLAAAGMAPPGADGVDRKELRLLIQRGLVVERDGCWFHPSAVEAAAQAAARLLAGQPDGFTMAELRDAIGATRKHALPLANELDARGVTRRRGDLRIAGPRLPALDES